MDNKPPETSADAPEELVRARLQMVTAYAQMVEEGYDALLHHKVNFRSLPEFKDTALLKQAAKLPLSRGRDKYLHWISRMTSAIRAAVKRTTFRKV